MSRQMLKTILYYNMYFIATASAMSVWADNGSGKYCIESADLEINMLKCTLVRFPPSTLAAYIDS